MLDVPYVIASDTQSEGRAWWRKWSNGWLEQGGFYDGVAYCGPSIITMYIPFNTPWFTFIQTKWVPSDGAWYTGTTAQQYPPADLTDIGGSYYPISGSQVGVQRRSGGVWYACGYAA